MNRPLQVVAFVSLEEEEPDLIVSFALEPDASHSITLLRTPRYEDLLSEEERGVAVMSGSQHSERDLLVAVTITPEEIVIESRERTRRLSARKLSAEDRDDAVNMLRRMNFDGRFVINAA